MVNKPSNGVLFAVVALTMTGVVATVAVYITSEGDSDGQRTAILVGSILGFIGPTLVSLLALLRTNDVAAKVTDVRSVVDGQMTRLVGEVETARKDTIAQNERATAAELRTTHVETVAALKEK